MKNLKTLPSHSGFLTYCFFLLALAWRANAADLIAISPVSDRILLLQFREGHADFTTLGQEWRNQTLYYRLLDINLAEKASSYKISSNNDANFGASGKSPLEIFRKSKLGHVGDMFDNSVPDYLSDHWIYLQLPHAMQEGKSYQIDLSGVASNANRWNFDFIASSIISQAIRMNQIGYKPIAKKFAYISQYLGDGGGLDLASYQGENCHVIADESKDIVYTGKITIQKSKESKDSENANFGPNNNHSQADVYQCEFTELTRPGSYRVFVPRMGVSHPFKIADDVYRTPYQRAMRALFFQRSGIDKLISELGNIIYPASYTQNNRYYQSKHGREEMSGNLETDKKVDGIWGWYFDAGDWDTYLWVHSKVPAQLLLAFDMYPNKFSDGDVGNQWKMPGETSWRNEGTNGIPDLLDEAGWYIAFMKRAKDALQSSGFGTGGVPAYVGIDAGADAGVSSWTDTRDLAVNIEDAGVTAIYAGLAAWYGAALQKSGQPNSAYTPWINDAKTAFAWANSHGASGEEKAFGAMGLYRATAEASYQTHFLDALGNPNWEYWSGPEWGTLASLLFAILPDVHANLNVALRTSHRANIIKTADDYWVTGGLQRGFRATHITPWQRNILGYFSTPRTLFPAVAAFITNESRFHDATQFAADYTLGGNQMGMVWMSGVGWNFDRAPFHPDSWYLIDYNSKVYENPILPGLVSYGTHETPDWWGWGYSWEGDEDFSRSSAYPAIENNASTFAAGEMRFPNRVNIPASEFTIHQNQLHAIFTFATLTGAPSGSKIPQPPTVELSLNDKVQVGIKTIFPLSVKASLSTYKVEYFQDWHYIGSSLDASKGFSVDWLPEKFGLSSSSNVIITAVAYDIAGNKSLPSPMAAKTVSLVPGETIVGLDKGSLKENQQEWSLHWKKRVVSVLGQVGDSRAAVLEIRSVLGSLAKKWEVTAGESIDLGFLPAGAYLVRFKFQNQVLTRSIVLN